METEEDLESYLAMDTLVDSRTFSASEITQSADRIMDNAHRAVSLQENRDSPTPD